MATGQVRLLYPRAERYLHTGERIDRGWDGNLTGRRVCFLDNGRPNADRLLALVEARLQARYGIQSRWIRKTELSVPGRGAHTAVPIGKLAPGLEKDTDVVITALAN